MLFLEKDPAHFTNDISSILYYSAGKLLVSIVKFCHSKFEEMREARSYNLTKDCSSKSIELKTTGKYTQYKSESNPNNYQSYDQQQNRKVDDDTKNRTEENLGNLCFSIFYIVTGRCSNLKFVLHHQYFFITDISSPSKTISSDFGRK